MTEESGPQDSRRSRSLEQRAQKAEKRADRLAAERDDCKKQLREAQETIEKLGAHIEALTAENKELESSRDQAEKRAEKAKKQAETLKEQNESLSEQVDALLKENRELSERLETETSDLPKFRQAALEAADKIEAAHKEAEEAKKTLEQVQTQFKQLQEERNSLEEQVATLNLQLQEEGKTPIVPADRVAEMLKRMIDQLRGGLRGVNVRTGEIRLKVAFGVVAEREGFVLPTVDSPPEVRENLHEVVIRFDRNLP